MTKLSKSIITVVVCIVILLSIVMFVIMPKQEVSFNENRYLQKAPKFSFDTLFSGELTEDIELYINDHFPFRDTIVGIKSICEKAIGKTSQNDIYLGENEFLIKKYYKYDLNIIERQCERLNEFAQSTDAKSYIIIVPTSNLIYFENKPEYAKDDLQSTDIRDYYLRLKKIEYIDVIDSLYDNKDDYQLYFRLDHHWNSYGAYFAYVEFCNKAGITPYSMDDFDIERVTDDFNGTYYSKSTYYGYTPDVVDVFNPKFDTDITYYNVLKETKSDSLYFASHLETKDKYSYFLDGNQPLIKIENKAVENEKSIAVVKDSYANIFIPFLANHYSSIYVIDMRYFNENLSDFVNDKEIDEVLFLYNIETLKNDIGVLKIK